MIVDEQSEKIIDNLDLQDDILRQNVAGSSLSPILLPLPR